MPAGDIQKKNSVEGKKFEAERWDWPLQHADGVVKVVNTKERFEVALEVPFFQPNEVDVKVCGGELAIHCLHEQSGNIKREINRSYHLPADVDKKTIKSKLSPKGVLLITADKIQGFKGFA